MTEKELWDLLQNIDNHLSDVMYSNENIAKRLEPFKDKDGNVDYINGLNFCISESRIYSQNLIADVLIRSGLIDKMDSGQND
ncbi:hypothetical protein [Mammaliicoccus sciuri]|uniref:hypothetical protein n=1 Tax=Mammaliicoccus sciuri TaxID=1296 RepID=UPI003F559381